MSCAKGSLSRNKLFWFLSLVFFQNNCVAAYTVNSSAKEEEKGLFLSRGGGDHINNNDTDTTDTDMQSVGPAVVEVSTLGGKKLLRILADPSNEQFHGYASHPLNPFCSKVAAALDQDVAGQADFVLVGGASGKRLLSYKSKSKQVEFLEEHTADEILNLMQSGHAAELTAVSQNSDDALSLQKQIRDHKNAKAKTFTIIRDAEGRAAVKWAYAPPNQHTAERDEGFKSPTFYVDAIPDGGPAWLAGLRDNDEDAAQDPDRRANVQGWMVSAVNGVSVEEDLFSYQFPQPYDHAHAGQVGPQTKAAAVIFTPGQPGERLVLELRPPAEKLQLEDVEEGEAAEAVAKMSDDDVTVTMSAVTTTTVTMSEADLWARKEFYATLLSTALAPRSPPVEQELADLRVYFL